MKIFLYLIYVILSNSRFSRPITLIFILSNKISIFEFSLIQMGYFVAKLLSEFPSGILADFMKRKYSLAIGCFLASISALLLYGVNLNGSFWILLLLFCLDGVASSFQSGSDQAMLYDYLKENGISEKYIKLLGIAGAISAITLGVTAAIGGLLADYSLTLPFLIQGIIFLIGGGLILFFPEDNFVHDVKRQEKSSPFKIASEGFNIIKKIPVIQFLILFLTVLASSTNAISMYMQGYFESLNISNAYIGIIFGVSTALSAIALLNSERLVKLGLKKTLIITTAMFFIGCLFLMTGNVILVILGFYLIYLKLDILEPSLFSVANLYVSERVRATVLSSFGVSLSLAPILMYPVFGIIGTYTGYKGIIAGMAIMSIPSFVYLFVFYTKYKIGESKPTNIKGLEE